MLLSDNFDYQTVAKDLVPGVLSEQELGSTMYIHELARVRSGSFFLQSLLAWLPVGRVALIAAWLRGMHSCQHDCVAACMAASRHCCCCPMLSPAAAAVARLPFL